MAKGMGGGASFAMDAPEMSRDMDDLVEPSRTRKNFPETWMWTNTMTG